MKRIHWFRVVLILALSIGLGSCADDKSLEPDMAEEPIIQVNGMIDGQYFNYVAGEANIAAKSQTIDLTSQPLRYYDFIIADTLVNGQSIEFLVTNHEKPYGDFQYDLDATFNRSFLDYLYTSQPPSVPFDPGRIMISYYWPGRGSFQSVLARQMSPDSYFTIRHWTDLENDGLKYKKIFFDFACKMIDTSYQDTIQIKNGRGVIVFGGR